MEEINSAYQDMMEELGNFLLEDFCPIFENVKHFPDSGLAGSNEDDFDELMPSCLPLLCIDYIYLQIVSCCKNFQLSGGKVK